MSPPADGGEGGGGWDIGAATAVLIICTDIYARCVETLTGFHLNEVKLSIRF